MSVAKRKVSVTLDADLVDELERGDDGLSKQINDAIRDTVDRRRRLKLLASLLGSLDRRHGKVSEALIDKYERLLG